MPSPPVIPPATSAALSSLPPVSSAAGPLAVLVPSLVPDTVSTLVSSAGTELVLPQPATNAAAMVVASSRFFTIVAPERVEVRELGVNVMVWDFHVNFLTCTTGHPHTICPGL